MFDTRSREGSVVENVLLFHKTYPSHLAPSCVVKYRSAVSTRRRNLPRVNDFVSSNNASMSFQRHTVLVNVGLQNHDIDFDAIPNLDISDG